MILKTCRGLKKMGLKLLSVNYTLAHPSSLLKVTKSLVFFSGLFLFFIIIFLFYTHKTIK